MTSGKRDTRRPAQPAPVMGCCDIEIIKPQPECFGNWSSLDDEKCGECNIWGYCADVSTHIRAALRKAQQAPAYLNTRVIPCPVCGEPTFWNITDGSITLFCMSDACKWKQPLQPQQQPPADALAELEAREDEVFSLKDIVENAKARYEDTDSSPEDALDDVRYHLEGLLIELQEKIAQLRQEAGK